MIRNFFHLLFSPLILWPCILQASIVVDFEELNTFTATETNGGMATGQYYNGDDGTGTSNSNGWSSQSVFFENTYTNAGTFDFWNGWAYSNVVDVSTPGFFNEYAAFPGGGSDGAGGVDVGGNYAIAFTGSEVTSTGTPLNGSTFTLGHNSVLQSVDLALSTYTALYVRDGLDGFGTPDFDPFAQFGPGDFLRLSITGFDDVAATGNQTGEIDIDVALDNAVLLDNWTTHDLSALGEVRSVRFAFTSSQISTFPPDSFLDTPSYIAVDNLRLQVVPEPTSLSFLMLAGCVTLLRRSRERAAAT